MNLKCYFNYSYFFRLALVVAIFLTSVWVLFSSEDDKTNKKFASPAKIKAKINLLTSPERKLTDRTPDGGVQNSTPSSSNRKESSASMGHSATEKSKSFKRIFSF